MRSHLRSRACFLTSAGCLVSRGLALWCGWRWLAASRICLRSSRSCWGKMASPIRSLCTSTCRCLFVLCRFSTTSLHSTPFQRADILSLPVRAGWMSQREFLHQFLGRCRDLWVLWWRVLRGWEWFRCVQCPIAASELCRHLCDRTELSRWSRLKCKACLLRRLCRAQGILGLLGAAFRLWKGISWEEFLSIRFLVRTSYESGVTEGRIFVFFFCLKRFSRTSFWVDF